LEGGVECAEDGVWFECGWCTISDETGMMNVASTARCPISAKVMERLEGGEELGDVVDDLGEQIGARHHGGYMGAITNGGA